MSDGWAESAQAWIAGMGDHGDYGRQHIAAARPGSWSWNGKSPLPAETLTDGPSRLGATRLFHFSDDPDIAAFRPRPVAIPSQRPPGRDWLNGPLVWVIDEPHQPMYLFPRDCPRVLIWPRADTTADDLDCWFGNRTCRMIAHIEWAWLDRLQRTTLYRYELPPDAFEPLDDAGMWVSRQDVTPIRMDIISDLPAALRADGVELRIMESLAPLRDVWSTSLHASGIRLRNALDWATPTAKSQ